MFDAGFFKSIYDSLSGFPILQAAFGAMVLLMGMKLMLKADRVKDGTNAPAPLPAPAIDPVQLHLQGSVAYLDMMREKREILKESRDHLARIAECVRIMREQALRHTDLLERIEREQDIQGRHRHHE